MGQAEALWLVRPKTSTTWASAGGACPPYLKMVESGTLGDLPRCPTGLTQVDIREALRGDGVGCVFVNVLQAQAGKLWFVKESGL